MSSSNMVGMFAHMSDELITLTHEELCRAQSNRLYIPEQRDPCPLEDDQTRSEACVRLPPTVAFCQTHRDRSPCRFCPSRESAEIPQMKGMGRTSQEFHDKVEHEAARTRQA